MDTGAISLFALALGALGNRCWGWQHGDRAIGVFLMTAGIVMANQELAIHFVLFAVLVWLFRFKGTGDTWLAFIRGENRMKALLRGALILPLGGTMTALTGEWWHIAIAMAFPIVAYMYHWCGKLKNSDPVIAAELLAGAYVVSVTL